jgi:sulfur-carrier protein adenylyltransferase/sulfurtransferase
MLNQSEQLRYQKHLILDGFGTEAQLKLKIAKVLVVGAGGLGCPALLYLTAAGLGTIGIVDHDVVDLSNLQRQVLYQTPDIGKRKTEAAIEKLKAQNPLVHFVSHTCKLSRKNALDIIAQYDVVLDATDNFAVRYLINDVCLHYQKPFVYGAIHRFEGQVAVFNYTDSQGLTGPSYRCVFPEKTDGLEIPNCADVGVLGLLPGLVGVYQALEVVKILTGIGKPLSGVLLLIDTLQNTQHKIKVRSSANPQALINKLNIVRQSAVYEDVIYDELLFLQKENAATMLLDVRSAKEYTEQHLPQALHIALPSLSSQHELLPTGSTVVVYCQSGQRSMLAIEQLVSLRPDLHLYNLLGGIQACR